MLKRLGVLSLFFLSACTGLPEGVTPVTGFDSNRYLGTWHEIARLDHSFERNLERVTATYAANEDGSISVLNKGFNTEQGEWRQAEGVAKPMGVAEDYSYAFVAGYNTDYLWLLSREPEVSAPVREAFLMRSEQLGFATSELIWPATQ